MQFFCKTAHLRGLGLWPTPVAREGAKHRQTKSRTQRRTRHNYALNLALNLHQIMLDGVDHQIGSVRAAGLIQDVGAVLVDGALRDEEFVGYLLV